MRILRVITRLDVQGGAELSTLVEAEEHAARGHRVMVVTVVEQATPAAVRRLDAAGVEHHHLAGRLVRQASALRSIVRTWQPDVVHAVIWRAELVVAAATVGLRVPTLVSLVNMQYAPEAVAEAPSPRRLDLLRRIEGLVLRRRVDHFHCLTRAGAAHSNEHLGIEWERITVVPRGRRSTDLVAGADEVQRARSEFVPDGGLLVVNVGRHELQKGQDLLLQVMADPCAPDGARLLVAGREGNRTAALTDALAGMGLEERVQLLGARRDVAALLGAADVVAVASRWEGLGGSIIEALASGAPIVAFGVSAVAEVVGDAGVIIEPFDTAAFAAALDALWKDPDRRAELAEAARQRFDSEFELGGVVDRIEDLYRSMVDVGDR